MPLKDKNILVIDDTDSIRTFLRISLQTRGVIFHQAANAEEGVFLCNEVKPEVVVMDLGLPDKDGLDIISEIKQVDVKGKPPSIVILSVRNDNNTKDKAFKLGADDYITKPFLMDDLMDVISNLLTKDINKPATKTY
ncbi:MAG: response regulator with CheY-like receiver domain and winged-helix DNA-binding domain [Rickettsiaceae bacterium]|jgi:DNA-binding response OmpR family regulator|nr:response regulator with CheY-like receiver domain and winged-helix DNA-binding domain [Rickettsiaceae bacterium]